MSTALVPVYLPSSLELNRELTKMERELDNQKSALSVEVNTLMAAMRSVQEQLAHYALRKEHEFADQHKVLKTIREALREFYLSEEGESVTIDDVDDVYFVEHLKNTRKRNASMSERNTDLKVKRSPKMKRLYRVICQKCHPDRVKNPRLNELFLVARRAYDSIDMETMYKVYEALRRGLSYKALILQDQVEELDVKKHSLIFHINQLQQNPLFPLMVKESSPLAYERVYANAAYLEELREQVEAELRSLRKFKPRAFADLDLDSVFNVNPHGALQWHFGS